MLQFIKRTAASVTNAATGKLKIFVDSADDLVKTKDEAGLLRVFGDGITNIALISTVGRVKTYRITRQSGATFDYTTTDGLDGVGQPATNNPSSIDPDDAASIGTVTNRYALEDHQHAIVAAAPTANLTATTTNAEGTAASFARSDHSHAISTAAAIQIVAGATAGAGNSTELARANHVHSVSTAAAGQVSVATAAEGTATSLARSDHVHSVSTATPVALGATAAEGTATSLARSDHVHVNPVIAHEAAADPHPQYLTQTEGDGRYVQPAQLPPSPVSQYLSAFLSTTQANTTVTPATLTGHSFTLPAGKVATVMGVLAATAAATGTGIAYGIQVVHGAGADGNVVGAIFAEANNSSASAATATSDGDVVNVAAGATATVEAIGAASVAGNNGAFANAVLRNTATNVAATINIVFRSEVAGSAVTAQVGSGATVIIN